MNTTTIYATAAEAISASISQDEITRCERTSDNIADLLSLCADNVEHDSEHEFWGDDEHGNEWRVHVPA